MFPKPPDVYVADGPIQRFDRVGEDSPIRVEVDDLQTGFGLAIASSGEMYVGDYAASKILQFERNNRRPIAISEVPSRNLWGLALSADDKTLFASLGGADGAGEVFKLAAPLDGKPPVLIWKSKSTGGAAVTVAAVRKMKR